MYKDILNNESPETSEIKKMILESHDLLTDISSQPIYRGDTTVSINDVMYNVDDYDQCVNGHTTNLYQTPDKQLIVRNGETYDVIMKTENKKDTNISKYLFIPARENGEKKMIEKVVGTTFRFKEQGEKNFTEFAGVIDKTGDIPTLQGRAILVPDPQNKYDPNAVMVIAQMRDGSAFHLGYLPKGSPLQQVVKTNTLAKLNIIAYSEGGDYNDSFTVEVEQ